MIDEQHKSKKVVTQREVNPKQVVPQIKEEKEQVTHTLTCILYLCIMVHFTIACILTYLHAPDNLYTTVANFCGVLNFVTIRAVTKITELGTPQKLPAIR